MSNQSTTTKEALEPCPFCGVTPTMQSHTQEDEMDEGRYVFFVECANSKCPMALVSTGGPYREPSKAAERWNSRVSAPIAPVVDTNGLIEWLELLVTALEADHKYDYKEWGQFIMGAENWAEKLRSASLPAEPRDHCAGASCADCKRDDCTCSHHGPASTVAPQQSDESPILAFESWLLRWVADNGRKLTQDEYGIAYAAFIAAHPGEGPKSHVMAASPAAIRDEGRQRAIRLLRKLREGTDPAEVERQKESWRQLEEDLSTATTPPSTLAEEDFERAFFCAKRALTHLKRKNHEFKPLECDGCKEVGLFLTEPGYRGDEHNPVGVDFDRPY